jgi:hypothetical protein
MRRAYPNNGIHNGKNNIRDCGHNCVDASTNGRDDGALLVGNELQAFTRRAMKVKAHRGETV